MNSILEKLIPVITSGTSISHNLVRHYLTLISCEEIQKSQHQEYLRALAAAYYELTEHERDAAPEKILHYVFEALFRARSINASRTMRDLLPENYKLLQITDADIMRDGGSRILTADTDAGITLSLSLQIEPGWQDLPSEQRRHSILEIHPTLYYSPIPKDSSEDLYLRDQLRNCLLKGQLARPDLAPAAEAFLTDSERRAK